MRRRADRRARALQHAQPAPTQEGADADPEKAEATAEDCRSLGRKATVMACDNTDISRFVALIEEHEADPSNGAAHGAALISEERKGSHACSRPAASPRQFSAPDGKGCRNRMQG